MHRRLTIATLNRFASNQFVPGQYATRQCAKRSIRRTMLQTIEEHLKSISLIVIQSPVRSLRWPTGLPTRLQRMDSEQIYRRWIDRSTNCPYVIDRRRRFSPKRKLTEVRRIDKKKPVTIWFSVNWPRTTIHDKRVGQTNDNAL